MTAAQFPVDGFFEAFVSLPDMGKAFGNRVKIHCFIQIFKLRIDAADQFAVFFAVSKKLKISLAQRELSLIPILYKPYMKLVSSQFYTYEINNTQKNKQFN